jgi:hypothetical protein
MANGETVLVYRTQFDGFLFALIGEQGNGTPLSVLSALARMDMDPWGEAAELARLPALAAAERLATLIAAIPDTGRTFPDSGAIADRLVELLPNRATVSDSLRISAFDIDAVIKSPYLIGATFAMLAFMFFSVFAFIVLQKPGLQAQMDNNQATYGSAMEKAPPYLAVP